jgi:hypothetical protein
MSYALAFAPDARTQWQELDLWLQELALDDADAMASAPPPTSEVVYRDMLHTKGNERHYLFLRFTVDHDKKQVTLIGLAHLVRVENQESN